MNIKRINGGLQFWQSYADELQRAEMQYGVPQEIIVALIGVETMYGNNRGRYTTLDALATLAFDYPRRATFSVANWSNTCCWRATSNST